MLSNSSKQALSNMRDRYAHYQELRNAIANLPDNPQMEGGNVLLSREQFDALKALKEVA